jgi:hypothetical protein
MVLSGGTSESGVQLKRGNTQPVAASSRAAEVVTVAHHLFEVWTTVLNHERRSVSNRWDPLSAEAQALSVKQVAA